MSKISDYSIKRFFEGLIVTMVVLFALGLCGWMVYEGTSEVRKNKEYIGYSIVVSDDTVKIVGYNASYAHYILSNGLIMNTDYVKVNAFKIRPKESQINGTYVQPNFIMPLLIDTN